MDFIIKVACSELVKRYVQKSTGKKNLPINEHNKFGYFLRLCLVQPTEIVLNSWSDKPTRNLTDVLHCNLNEEDVRYKLMVIHPKKQLDFNEWVKMDIHDNLFRHINACSMVGINIKEAIELFYVNNGLTPQLFSEDAARKSYWRKRKNINT